MTLLIHTLRAIAGAVVTPPLVFVLVILAVLLYLKNNKTVAIQKMILGDSVNSSIELTLSQLVLGIIAGAIGSIIINSLGIVFDQSSGISYLFLISILLMFIKPRLICFSYSGAILGSVSILLELLNSFIPNFQYKASFNIDILYLMTFVGVLHIIEGFLVIADGDRGSIPVFTQKEGKILGGYALKRYWVLPIAIMTALIVDNPTSYYPTTSIEMPNWWPLIKSSSMYSIIATSIISIFPLYAMLGYSSVTFTRGKKEKVISSGIHIISYGIILTIVSQLARIGILGQIIVVAFAPMGHEFMLNLQIKSEEKREPKFVSDEEGLTVLAIAETSKFKKFGVEIGDKILSVNGKSINSEAEIYTNLRENLYRGILKVKNSKGVIKDIDFIHTKNKRLGILLVPRNVEKEDVIPVKENNFQNVLDELKNKSNNSTNLSNRDKNMNENKNDKNL